MSQPSNSYPAFRNRILAGLPPDEVDRLRPHLQPVPLDQYQTLWESGEPIPFVYFPEAGIASVIANLEDGEGIEVGMIGREGMIGVPVVLGRDRVPTRVEVQIPGHGYRMDGGALRQVMDQGPATRSMLLRYAQLFYDQVTQTAACNGRHHITDRLARWLLMSHDRTDGDDLSLTQEYLGIMLGVRRSGVTIAARMLQSVGLIKYRHGLITILDRPGLEEAACECYAIVRGAAIETECEEAAHNLSRR